MTLKFILSLLKKKVEVLEVIGQHKQIPSTFAAFDADQSFYIVQEFIPGQSLQAELVAGQPWPTTTVLQLLQEVLSVLAFAQEHGVLHGNLKPSKVIRHQTNNCWVMLDLGSVRNISQNVSSKDSVQPQPALKISQVYLAPEQFQGQVSCASDHYALGMIAIQALTGLPAEELPTAKHPKLHQELVALLEEIPELSLNVAGLLARMVHPNPTKRYAKATEILADLERLQTSEVSLSNGQLSPPTLSADAPAVVLNEVVPPRRLPWGLIGGAGLALLALFTGLMALKLPHRLIAAQRLREAQLAAQVADSDTAIAHYNQVLELSPNHAAALAGRSKLQFAAGDTEAALADITQAIESHPEHPGYAYDRANLRFAVGDVQGAIADYTTAIQQDPGFLKAYVNRGSARADWGDDQGAIEDYTQAIDLNAPTDIRAAAYLNRCLSYSNLGEQVLALADCSEAINLRPSHSLAYQNRGLVRRRLGEFQGSLQDYNIAIQIEPNSPDPYYNRGLTRQAMNDVPGAMDDFSKAIAIAPDHVLALYDRGLLQADTGNLTAALSDFRQASQLCLELGRTGCYEDAQYQITRIQTAASPVTEAE
jgi:serine/threonine-protein kinase